MHRPPTVIAATTLLICTPAALRAQDTPPPAAAAEDLGVDARVSFEQPTTPFGTRGQRHWSLTTGAGFALEHDDDSVDGNLRFAYHYFLIEDFEFIGELGGWYFAQDGDDAAGINPGFTLRYHFINRDRWTLFADAGIGLLFSTGDVPTGGTSFNFTPHVGLGGTYRLGDAGTRLVAGAGWHHVSNARFEGDSSNPDRDGVFVYAGVMWPF